MTETSIGYGYDNRIQWMFFIAKHINNWSSIYKNKMHAYSMKNVEII